MSEEQLKAFAEKVQSDPSLQEQLKADGADVIAIAKAAGFTITQEELNAVAGGRQKLTDADLENVDAGAGCGPLSPNTALVTAIVIK